MGYDRTAWKKTDDEIIRDHNDHDYLGEKHAIELELQSRGYIQQDNQWVHKSNIDYDDDSSGSAGLIGLGLLAVILLVGSFYFTVYVHMAIHWAYVIGVYSLSSFAFFFILMIITKGNSAIRFFYGISTFAATASTYPFLIAKREGYPNYDAYFWSDTGYFPLVFYALGFVVYILLVTWLAYKLTVGAIKLFNKDKENHTDSDISV
ncbi:hypothetical protein ASG99_13685 [Bacillus sp. Soil768D1]|nr:hypothetical protein ASG99_13685 [Bacillus sp. Soil768D1]